MNPSEQFVEHGISQQVVSFHELALYFELNENLKKTTCANVLTLAYQSLGVVYGDLSTSPLYVYKTSFSGKLSLKEDDEEIFGVLSFIFWTFTIIALFKYVFIVMSADDNGEGGTFALYSLLCRHAKLSILPNQQPTDENLSAYSTEDSADTWQSSVLKLFIEKHPRFQTGLLIFVLLGTCMTIGDGVITPAISVFSAVSGVQVKINQLHDNYVVIVSCIILVGLFSIQHHGTHRVAFLFAPVVAAWLLCISGIGIYNIFRWNRQVYRALSPVYMFRFLKTTGIEGWLSLSGVVLSITGVETMYADMGHFSALSIKGWLSLPLSSVCKIPEGGWIPILLSFIFMAIMFTWNYGTMKKHQFDVENKVSMTKMLSLGPCLGMVRVPGIGLIFSNLASGIPAIFGHFITNLPAFHQVLVFVCAKSVQVPYVSENERLVISRVGPKEYHMFRCIVRYGYKDMQQENYNFENKLVSEIIQFIEIEDGVQDEQTDELTIDDGNINIEESYKVESSLILKAKELGVTYIVGHSYAEAKKSSSILKKFGIDVVFAFLSKNCREPDIMLEVAHTSLLEVELALFKEEFAQTHKEEEPMEGIELEQGDVAEETVAAEESVADNQNDETVVAEEPIVDDIKQKETHKEIKSIIQST
ncbi:potassium transporter 1-like protein [Trifolium pratense]|uniref:Potassium transporter 1-like protein n=1 Tax=Trifolium pratense TaxID=57577 RepID=A0A2K3NXE0_TRIPR|nr:potassium transporter 1-like protein [Trifolium pratense]